jgi:uncharacterized small protein (DUF1192 family)
VLTDHDLTLLKKYPDEINARLWIPVLVEEIQRLRAQLASQAANGSETSQP